MDDSAVRAMPDQAGRTSRSRSKELTRQALLRAALTLLSRRSFDAISLREVTREAGVSPTAFYRHFGDMEELGLRLVDESFSSLRELLREARAAPSVAADAVKGSIEVLVEHVHRHEGHIRFIARERYGGVASLRRAIRYELRRFADDLARELETELDGWPEEDRLMFAELIVERMVTLAHMVLDAGADEVEVLGRRIERQMRLVMLAVPRWRVDAV